MIELIFTLVLDLDQRFVACTLDHVEGPNLHVGLNFWIAKLATNESLGIVDRVIWISMCLVNSTLSNFVMVSAKSNVRWRRRLSLKIVDNLNFVVSPDANARVCRAKINANGMLTRCA